MANQPPLIRNSQAFYALILWVILFFIVNLSLMAVLAATKYGVTWLRYVVGAEALIVFWYLVKSRREPKRRKGA